MISYSPLLLLALLLFEENYAATIAVDGECHAGSYWNSVTSTCEFCRAGYFGYTSGYIDSDTCTGQCTAGYYCPAGSFSTTQRECGTANYYCPAGSESPTRVLPGYYTTISTSDSPSSLSLDPAASIASKTSPAQYLCEAGYWCKVGIRSACAAGTYGQLSGLQTPDCTDQCPSGSYCPTPGTPTPIPCPAGTFTNASGSTTCSECPVGHFCTEGSVDPVKCPAGTLGNATGLTSRGCSTLCNNDMCNVSECPSGFYCPVGTITPKPCNTNDDTFSNYCPAGSREPTVVPAGYYTDPSASYITKCSAGSYCTDGEETPCPEGTYGETTGLETSECTASCPEGFYCPEGSTGFYNQPCGPDASHYCPAGSGSPILVSEGYYSTGGRTINTAATQEECPLGSFCVDGVRHYCPTGTYGDEVKLSTIECSGRCGSNGYVCPTVGHVSSTQSACPAGTFSAPDGVSCLECSPGYYCTEASPSATQYDCGGENFYCPLGSDGPIVVESGYYSTGGGVSALNRPGQAQCKQKNCIHLPQCPSTTVE